MKIEIYVVGRYFYGHYTDWPEFTYRFYTNENVAWAAFEQTCYDIWADRTRKFSWKEELLKEEKNEWFNNRDEYKNDVLTDDDWTKDGIKYISWSFKGVQQEARIMAITVN